MVSSAKSTAATPPFVPDWLTASRSRPTAAPLRNSEAFLPAWMSSWHEAQTDQTWLARKTGAGPKAQRGISGQSAIDNLQVADKTAAEPLLVSGARCILPSHGIYQLDIHIADGKIQQLGTQLDRNGCRVIDADGCYVTPGIIDPHTHVGLFDAFRSEIPSESRSALLNGVTTMGIYLGGQRSYLDILADCHKDLAELSAVDAFFHLAIFTREQLEEIPIYYSRYGITSYKAYMCGIPGFIPSLDEGFLLDLMSQVAALGEETVLNIHAENYHIVEWATEHMREQHPQGISLPQWTQTHPDFAEAEAVQRAAYLAQKTGARIYFVHISSAETLQMIRQLKAAGSRFFVETTSPYLTLTDQTDLGPLAKMVPPIRTEEDRRALWQALEEDLIDTIGSDHTPLTVFEKKPHPLLWDTMPGYPAVGTHVPSLLNEADRLGFPLLKLIEKMTIRPATIFGLYPRKGTLLPGSDADLVIVDPLRKQPVTAERAASRSDFALHQGKELVGWPRMIIKAGRVIDMASIA